MERLNGVYEGRIVSLGEGNATAFVPQVFGDTTIVISNFLATPVVGRGWVTFQAGDPEHPVWLSGAFVTAGGVAPPGEGGSGFTYSQDFPPTDPSEDETWFNTVTGASYIWLDDGTSQQWVQFAPGGGGTTEGGAGGGDSYVHNQGVVASTWTITHNLGYYPNVTVIDSALSTVEGDVTQISTNVLRLQFSAAFTGTAYLS
jgi:hypothetical protein